MYVHGMWWLVGGSWRHQCTAASRSSLRSVWTLSPTSVPSHKWATEHHLISDINPTGGLSSCQNKSLMQCYLSWILISGVLSALAMLLVSLTLWGVSHLFSNDTISPSKFTRRKAVIITQNMFVIWWTKYRLLFSIKENLVIFFHIHLVWKFPFGSTSFSYLGI